MARVTSLAAAVLLVAVAASAQQPGSPPRVSQRGGVEQPVQLQFQDGRVTLRVQNAPVRAILAEWARLGGATIVNGDKVAGPPLTLELTGVPERQALDVVLRSVAGYMLAPRRAGATGASAFDRIMILPTSVAPRNPPPAPAAATAPRPSPLLPRPPVIARPPEPALVEQPGDAAEPDEAVADAASPSDPTVAPVPGQPRVLPRPLVRPPVMPPGGIGAEIVPEQEEPEVAQPGMQPAVVPTPSNPFGIPAGSSTTPGVIAPAPRQQQQPNRVQ
ncbi:MAG: hypothetical protein HYU37_06020 [Acidobacteria bacterium]|nr:hypothetical protein [Acidobacteriota bacterium]